jgi:hypothetical protein
MILALSASCAAVTAGIYGWTIGEPWYECAAFGSGGAIIAILFMIGAWELNNVEQGMDHGVSVLGLVFAIMVGYGIYFFAGEEIYPSAGTAVGIGMVMGIILMVVVVVLGELLHRRSRKKLRRNLRPIGPDSR